MYTYSRGCDPAGVPGFAKKMYKAHLYVPDAMEDLMSIYF
jgi:hypothetical protein